jgi:hypothetical protein
MTKIKFLKSFHFESRADWLSDVLFFRRRGVGYFGFYRLRNCYEIVTCFAYGHKISSELPK